VHDVAEATIRAVAIYEKERRSRLSDRRWLIVSGAVATGLAGLIGWLIGNLP
jgi:hypothetical protein